LFILEMGTVNCLDYLNLAYQFNIKILQTAALDLFCANKAKIQNEVAAFSLF
jgi:hypothetical protein